MAKRRRTGLEIETIGLHAFTLLGLILAGGGLLLGVWGLVVKEQEAQRAMSGQLFQRIVVEKNSQDKAGDMDLDNENPFHTPLGFNQQYGYTTQVNSGYVLAGLAGFVVGGYLAALGVVGLSRRRSEALNLPAAPMPVWVESLEAGAKNAEPGAAADRGRS